MILKTVFKELPSLPSIICNCVRTMSTQEVAMPQTVNKFSLPARYAGSEKSVW